MRLFAVTILLFTAVPAGCLPVMAVGSVAGAFKSPPKGRLPDPTPKSTSDGFIFAGVLLVLAIVANRQFRRILRRTHSQEQVGPLGLGNAAWRFTLWGAFSAGVACGGVMAWLIFEVG